MLVLAGGFGSRLKPLIPNIPKAMAPIGETPFIAIQLRNWIRQGIRSFVFLLHHDSDQIIAFLEKNKDEFLRECEIVTVVEPVAMDTGGAVAYAIQKLGLECDFLVVNADTWLGNGVQDLIKKKSPVISVVRNPDTLRYGKIEIDSRQFVINFKEKCSENTPSWINAGMYLLNSGLFLPWDGTPFSLERELLKNLASKRLLQAVQLQTSFIDIGIPEDFKKFCRLVEESGIRNLCD